MAASIEVTGVVLAGGRGTRAGAPKAQIAMGDETLLERAVRRLAGWLPRVLVSVRSADAPVPDGATPVVDSRPGAGPLAALADALHACPTPWALAVACDMPDVDRATCERLLARTESSDADAIVPADADGRLQPLHACYRTAAAPALTAVLEQGERAMHRGLAALRCEVVPLTELADLPGAPASLAGLNTAAAVAERQADETTPVEGTA